MLRKLTILCAFAVFFNITDASAQDVAAIRNAAEQGNAAAQYSLGVMYDNGRGVPGDDARAVWFRKAAEQGLDAARQDRGSSVIGMPPWVQSYSDSNKSCTSWTDDCVTCKRDVGAELACSNIGITCQPKDVRCLDSIKTTPPK